MNSVKIASELVKIAKELANELDMHHDTREIALKVISDDTPFMVSESGKTAVIGLFKTWQDARAFARGWEKKTGRIPYTSSAAAVPEIKKMLLSILG